MDSDSNFTRFLLGCISVNSDACVYHRYFLIRKQVMLLFCIRELDIDLNGLDESRRKFRKISLRKVEVADGLKEVFSLIEDTSNIKRVS
jgi:hypothetical protein